VTEPASDLWPTAAKCFSLKAEIQPRKRNKEDTNDSGNMKKINLNL
jgi:hypothetical protein